jgi:acyl dehydratase
MRGMQSDGVRPDDVMYAEDFAIGLRREIGSTTIDEDAVIRFATEFDPQSFHIDKAASAQGFHGGIIASGWHTCSVTMRIMVDNYLSKTATLGSPGVDELRWFKPVRPGDTLTVYSTVSDVRNSRSKPDRAVVTTVTEVENQVGEVVMSMRGMSMVMRRPASPAAGSST